MSHLRNAIPLVLWALFALTTSQATHGEEFVDWTGPNAFPAQIPKLINEFADARAAWRGASDQDQAVIALNSSLEQLNKLIEAQRSIVVEANLSVVRVTGRDVHLLPDVTYGWPTLEPENMAGGFEKSEFYHGAFSAVRLRTAAGPLVTIPLQIGKDIPASDARLLMWNDKVRVRFRVASVKQGEQRPKTFESLQSQEAWLRWVWCEVAVSDFQFIKSLVSPKMASARTAVWPGPGTLPYILAKLPEAKQTYAQGRASASLVEYADYSGASGQGLVRAEDVDPNYGRSAYFSSRLVTPEGFDVSSSCTNHLKYSTNSPVIEIPFAAIPAQRLKSLQFGTPVLISFDVAASSDVASSGGRTGAGGGGLKVKNVRLEPVAASSQAEANLRTWESLARAHGEIRLEQEVAAFTAAADRVKEKEKTGSFFDAPAPAQSSDQSHAGEGSTDQQQTSTGNTGNVEEENKQQEKPPSWSPVRGDWLIYVRSEVKFLVNLSGLLVIAVILSYAIFARPQGLRELKNLW